MVFYFYLYLIPPKLYQMNFFKEKKNVMKLHFSSRKEFLVLEKIYIFVIYLANHNLIK